MKTTISGACWLCGDNVTVYDIIPEARWTMKTLDGEAMGNWVFETVEPGCRDVPGGFKKQGFRIVIAGDNFGCGAKSVEHPMAALKGAGVELIIAQSVSRYSYRNAINLALPILICPDAPELFHRGDQIEADCATGEIRNLTTGRTVQAAGLGDFAIQIIGAGGLIKLIEKELNRNGK